VTIEILKRHLTNTQ